MAAPSRSWKQVKKHVQTYTGGPVVLSSDDCYVVAACSERAAVLDLESGSLRRFLAVGTASEVQEPIVSFVVSPKGDVIVTASRSSLLRVWDAATGTLLREFKGPRGLVNTMAMDASGTLLAVGCADRAVMVFDVNKKFCTHNFKGHGGMVTLVKFHPDPKVLQLVSCGDDAKVMVWDLRKSASVANLKDHMSVVTSVAFAAVADGSHVMFTAGRDQVIHVWDASGAGYRLLKTLPVFEAIEGLEVISSLSGADDSSIISVISGGRRGHVRAWRCTITSKAVDFALAHDVMLGTLLGAPADTLPAPQVLEAPVSQQITALLYRRSFGQVLAVTADHNLVFIDATSLRLVKTLIGNNDDIIDAKYVPSPALDGTTSHKVAVATNSENLRIFDVDTFDTHIFAGHSEAILALDVSPDARFIATASKDKTARIWSLATGTCVGLCEGHTMAVGAVAWPKRARNFHEGQSQWLVTGSKDRTLKLWNTSPVHDAAAVSAAAATSAAASKKTKGAKAAAASVPASTPALIKLRSIAAVAAHDKDVNQVAVSPNDALIGTASQDKTVKLWRAQDLSLAGVLRGHKRGVWAVEFSPVDRCIASASGDNTVRLWSVSDFTCIKTLEGHTASVLCLKFLRQGTQLMTGSADGLVKLWNIRDSECVNTFQGHDSRIWTLALAKSRETIVANAVTGEEESHVIVERDMLTGGGDSVLAVWRDATSEEEAEARTKADAAVLEEQELFNRMAARDYQRTVELCLKLEKPGRLQAVLNELLDVGVMPIGGTDYTTEILAECREMAQEASGLAWRRAVGGAGGDDEQWVLDPSVSQDKREEGKKKLMEVVRALSPDYLDRLLRYIRDWNTQSRHNLFAQQLLGAMLKGLPLAKMKACASFADVVKAALPYSDRHFERMNRMIQSSYFLDYVQAKLSFASSPAVDAAPTSDAAPDKAVEALTAEPQHAGDAPKSGKKNAKVSAKRGRDEAFEAASVMPEVTPVKRPSGDDEAAAAAAKSSKKSEKRKLKKTAKHEV